jgi:hypothetical protein
MSKLLGLILLFVGGAMLYYGWQAHEAVISTTGSSLATRAEGSESVWLLTLGAVAAIWGLAVVLRRRV